MYSTQSVRPDPLQPDSSVTISISRPVLGLVEFVTYETRCIMIRCNARLKKHQVSRLELNKHAAANRHHPDGDRGRKTVRKDARSYSREGRGSGRHSAGVQTPLLSEFPDHLSAPTHDPPSLVYPASVASVVPPPSSKPQSLDSEMH